MQIHDGEYVLALKRGTTTEHLVKHYTNRIDVGTRGAALTTQLLRRHIIRGAVSTRQTTPCHTPRTFKEGKAEIDNFDVSIFQDHDILGLDIAMKNALLVTIG